MRGAVGCGDLGSASPAGFLAPAAAPRALDPVRVAGVVGRLSPCAQDQEVTQPRDRSAPEDPAAAPGELGRRVTSGSGGPGCGVTGCPRTTGRR